MVVDTHYSVEVAFFQSQLGDKSPEQTSYHRITTLLTPLKQKSNYNVTNVLHYYGISLFLWEMNAALLQNVPIAIGDALDWLYPTVLVKWLECRCASRAALQGATWSGFV